MKATIPGRTDEASHAVPLGEAATDIYGTCPNCGAARAGPFCQRCGQDGHLHQSIAGLGHDLLHGVFHFEGKLFNTLPLLVRHPGELTRRYVAGERVKFVTPMALFLFSVFLLFAAMNRLALPDVAGATGQLSKARIEVDRKMQSSARRLQGLEQERADRLRADPRASTVALDRGIADVRDDIEGMRGVARHLPSDEPPATGVEQKHGSSAISTRFRWIDRQIRSFNNNSALYAYRLKMASYKFSWALVPISLPFIWLLFFWRRDVGLYHHAIFAIHSLSFMTLLVVGLIGLFLLGIPAGWLWFAFLLAAPVHIFTHLKGGYRLRRWGALWRTVLLLMFTGVASLLFFAMLLWLEAE